MLLSSFLVSVETLRGNPLRTFLSTLGIVIGVAALVAVLSLGDGLEQYMRTQIGETTDLQTIGVGARLSRQVDGVAVPLDSVVQWSASDALALAASLGVPGEAGVTAPGIAVAMVGGTPRAVDVLGTTPALFAAQNVIVASGQPFGDADSAARVAMLSRRAARDLAPAGHTPLAPGDSLTLGRLRLSVIAVLGGAGSDRTVSAVVPIGVARELAPVPARWAPSIIVRAANLDDVPAARAGVERWLAARYGPGWKGRATVASRADRLAQAQQGFVIFKLVMGAITGICLLVGGIGVMNVLLAAVVERTREIGVRRAVGAAPRHILAQFLAESVTISGVGSVAGIALGLAGSYGITAAIRARTAARMYAGVSVSTVLVAVLATVTVGLVFGIYPALRASRLSPIDAIRHE